MIQYLKPRVIAKTASYTVSPAKGDLPGTLFTTRGAAGAITFTLPAPTPGIAGYTYEFMNIVGQNMIVSAGAGKAVTFNNGAAASLAAQTGGQLIGAIIRAVCDGTSWFLTGDSVGITYTVA